MFRREYDFFLALGASIALLIVLVTYCKKEPKETFRGSLPVAGPTEVERVMLKEWVDETLQEELDIPPVSEKLAHDER